MNSAETLLPSPLEAITGLEVLKAALGELVAQVRTPKVVAAAQLQRLARIVEEVGQDRPARRVVCPEEYRKQWGEVLAGKREHLEPRAIRYLCWESDIGTDLEFHRYLDHAGIQLNARSMQGLVHACHQKWCEDLFARNGIAERVRRLMRNYAGPNRIIRRWRDAESMILGRRGAEEFGKAILDETRSVKEQCARCVIDEQAEYVRQAVKSALIVWSNKSSSSQAALQGYVIDELVFWNQWPREDSKEVIAITILAASSQLAALLTPRILKVPYLGDPRLPINQSNWRGVTSAAKDRFISWLSAEDIAFFFEHVLPRGRDDPHGRKPFWLGYVDQVRMSRALLNWEDRQRMKGASPKGRVFNFGNIDAATSAFLLDFGRVLVVEFGSSGNACYVYEKSVAQRIVPDFWTAETFRVSRWLENSLKQPDKTVAKISHFKGWEWDMQQVLARYGIRPGTREW